MSDSLRPPRTVTHHDPLFMGFPRQEYWNELPFPSPGDLPNPGIKPRSHALQVDSLLTEPSQKPILIHTYNLFLAALGLCCCMDFSLFATSGHYSLVLVHRILIVVASLLAEYGL